MKGPFHNIDEYSKPLARKIVGAILPCDRLVDVGAGIRPYDLINPRVHLCIEPHGEYVRALSREGYPIIEATAVEALPLLRNFQTVLLLDVIEHMTKEDGLLTLDLATNLATKQVVVFTPLGFVKQEPIGDEKDPWGYQGWAWQTHRSGWNPSEFKGWETKVDPTFHGGHGAFFAVLNK